MFLKCHFEAILHCVAIFRHFTIHLRQELPRVFNDFDIFDNQTQSSIFPVRAEAQGSLCHDGVALVPASISDGSAAAGSTEIVTFTDV